MDASTAADPDLAIGTAKELIETICKTILDDRNIPYPDNEPLTKLVRITSVALSLTPEEVSDEARASKSLKGLLQSLSGIAHNIADVRNAYGTGHGKAAEHKGLSPRHARLAVGAASTLAVFLWETHKER